MPTTIIAVRLFISQLDIYLLPTARGDVLIKSKVSEGGGLCFHRIRRMADGAILSAWVRAEAGESKDVSQRS